MMIGFADQRLNPLGYARESITNYELLERTFVIRNLKFVIEYLVRTTGLEPAQTELKVQVLLPICIRPHKKKYARKDSNFQLADFKSTASAVWATHAQEIFDFRLGIFDCCGMPSVGFEPTLNRF